MLNLITKIEYINSFLSLALLGIIFITNTNYFARYKYSDGIRNNQLNNLEKDVDSKVKAIKPRRGRKKKTDTKTLPTINEEGGNEIRDKRETSYMRFIWQLKTIFRKRIHQTAN